ncbi:MAG: UDP-glucose 4-epimerase GalE [Flavobacteriales bacterium]|nr:UDP-glucose 4-epimerase GalE [Crocinitomicaceae bacterium]NBX80765.1 UDP-glucose 4-epimerase GalE [Flavobacteriales bacterium]
MSKYVLVTGGAGYIGSHTVVSLSENGYIPLILDNFENANRSVLNGLHKILGFEPILLEGDVCDNDFLKSIFLSYEIHGVIHFAAYKAVGESVKEPLKYYKNNLLGLINILNNMIEFRIKNLVFSSSCTVYGEPKGIKEMIEETPKNSPNSPYGWTKWMSEQIIEDVIKANPSLNIAVLRYFNPVGAHKSVFIGEFPIGKPNNLMPYITQTAIGKQEKLIVFGNDYPTIDGTCVRDYIHVIDLAEAHVKAISFLESKSGVLEAINIGTGKGLSVLEIINAFTIETGVQINWEFGPKRKGDVTEIFANANKAKTILGWEAKLSINDAINDAWNWEKKLAATK